MRRRLFAVVLASLVALAIGGSASGRADATGAPAAPDVALAVSMTKSADAASAAPGASNGYSITITNTYTFSVSFTLTDDLPAGFSYIAGTTTYNGDRISDPSVSGQRLTWQLSMGANSKVTIHFGVRVSRTPGRYFNSATGTLTCIECSETFSTGATAPIDVVAPEQPLTIAKTADASPVAPGSTDGYTITISNPNATGKTVSPLTDDLPPGFSYIANSTTGATALNPSVSGQRLTWSDVFVPANNSASIHFGIRVASTPGRYFNNASATWSVGDGTATASTGSTAPIDVVAQQLTMTKAADAPSVTVGGADGYTINISNPNPVVVNVSVADDLPTGFAYTPNSTSGAGEPIVSNQRLSWSIAVPANGTASLHFRVRVAPTPGTYWNSATGSAGAFTVAGTGPTAPIEVVPAQLTMTKSADAASVPVGSTDGYTITLSNPNASPVSVSVSDDLPPGFSYVSGSTSGATTANPSVSGQRLTWAGIAVPANGNASIHFQVTVSSVPGSYSNSASGSAGAVPVAGTGPTAPVTVVALQSQPPAPPAPPAATADLQVSETVSPSTVAPNDTVTYRFVVTNRGPNAAANVVLTARLGDGLTFVSQRTTQGTCTGTRVIRCALGGLASGASATVTIVARAHAAGSLVGEASASAAEADPVAANNSASDATSLLPPPVPGKKVNAIPIRGKVIVDGRELKAPDQVRVGAVIDTRKGEIRLVTKNGDAKFHDGIFQLRQKAQEDAITELVLKGGNFGSCKERVRKASLVTPLATKKPVRKLWGKGKGKFRTRARYSSATVRGTEWLTADRCDGTLTQVRQGTVVVDDFVAKKKVFVRAGQSYVAKRQVAKKQSGRKQFRRRRS